MKYLTGQHALNLPCSLLTCGDWHMSALQWERLRFVESEESVFGDYGIELDCFVPTHEERYAVANHIRALLDLLVDGKFTIAQGMRDDFICNDDYTNEVFEKVSMLKNQPNWSEIYGFMCREYKMKWVRYFDIIACELK